MDQTSARPSQSSGCGWLIVIFLLLFVFQTLLGQATKSHLANLIIVLAATLGAVVIFAIGYGVAAGVCKVYRNYRSQFRQPVSPQWILLGLEDLPPEIAAPVGDTASTLAPLGFRFIGCIYFTAAGIEVYQGLLHNQRAGTIFRCSLSPRDSKIEKLFSIQTRRSDGTDCVISHMSPRSFAQVVRAPTKGRSGLMFFDVEDPRRLARLQAAAVERYPSGLVDTGSLDPTLFCTETAQQEMATQVEAGYLTQIGDEYWATRIGALKMALKAVWPVSALRIRSARRQAERFLEETGL